MSDSSAKQGSPYSQDREEGSQVSAASITTLLQMRKQAREIAGGFRRSQILFTCVELGVFDALDARSSTAAEVAAALGSNTRGTELLLNAAAGLGLLEKSADRFSNSALAGACLTQDGAVSLVRSLRLERAFYRRWGNLADAVRTGRRPEENRQDEQPQEWVRNFIQAMYEMALPLAPIIAGALTLAQDRPLKLIDVGGGHGGYSIALANKYPRLTCTVFELPRVVPVTREIISNAGLAERVLVQEGDFQQEELGSGYDIALVFGVLNGEPQAGKPALIRKVFNALNPGGLIVLRDNMLEPDRAGPPDAAIFALQMLLATDSGGLDTLDDWAGWLASAGFSPPQIIELPTWVGSNLVVSRKPGAGR